MAKQKRITTPAKPVPQSREEAAVMLAEMGVLQRKLDQIALGLGVEIASLKVSAEDEAKPVGAELSGYFAALAAWAEANKGELLDGGKRRTVRMLQGELGWRWLPASVKLAKGTEEEDAIAALIVRWGKKAPVRIKHELDRESILRDPARIDDVAGIFIEQTEVFFVKPAELETERLATVQTVKGSTVRPAEGAKPSKAKKKAKAA